MSTNNTNTNNTQTDVPCTLDTCPLSDGIITYQPNIAGNAFFVAVFGVLLFVQLGLGIRHKTWSYLVAVVFGLILEVVGYVGRIQLHDDPFNFNFFIEYLVCLTIAPAFLTAAIYVTFARVVYSCDERLSWIRPKRISIIFMTCDFVCLVLQAAGGAITSTSSGESQEAADMRQTGVNIMIGGLAFQVVSLFLFILYAAVYAWRWHAASALHYRHRLQPAHSTLGWRSLVFGLAIASVTIFVRCAFRVAELWRGFQSPLASNEVAFMLLEGTMVIIACLCLTLGHPGLCLDIAWKRIDAVSSVDLENMHIGK
ncbi:putative RTA1 domain protein [Coniochaeta ligniaria NRRL 30616]|uniref:Putative RTA1 domain protein n=1 Tax=Coniochaeta ligniaria NRRL 30616 TaxID=1408157 RepID=A0A1J7JI85_9PEZI|nr:putative RTA1 domain protein [Coniochaeta ligniaria NRRL 30616]